jgi:hypothetical protein
LPAVPGDPTSRFRSLAPAGADGIADVRPAAGGADQDPGEEDQGEGGVEVQCVAARGGAAPFALCRDEAERVPEVVDAHARDDGGDEDRDEHHRGHPEPVVMAVGVRDRGDDEVGDDERHHAAERYAVGPKDDREGHGPDRADERDADDDDADDGARQYPGQGALGADAQQLRPPLPGRRRR